MRCFQLWFMQDGVEHLISEFRAVPSRQVWDWYDSLRYHSLGHWERFRLSSMVDLPGVSIGLPIMILGLKVYRVACRYYIKLCDGSEESA